MRKNLGSTITIVLGALTLIAGINALGQHQPTNLPTAGLILILGGVAYRIAKARRQSDRLSRVRIASEIVAVGAILFLWLGQHNLKWLIATDPVPELVFPVAVLAAYAFANLRKLAPVAS